MLNCFIWERQTERETNRSIVSTKCVPQQNFKRSWNYRETNITCALLFCVFLSNSLVADALCSGTKEALFTVKCFIGMNGSETIDGCKIHLLTLHIQRLRAVQLPFVNEKEIQTKWNLSFASFELILFGKFSVCKSLFSLAEKEFTHSFMW